jgi:hypothetical protein
MFNILFSKNECSALLFMFRAKIVSLSFSQWFEWSSLATAFDHHRFVQIRLVCQWSQNIHSKQGLAFHSSKLFWRESDRAITCSCHQFQILELSHGDFLEFGSRNSPPIL